MAANIPKLPPSLMEQLEAAHLLPFVDMKLSSPENIVISLYENEKRHLFYGWGNAVGIYLFPPFDRFQYTDDSGNIHVPSLSTIVPIAGHDWLGEWIVRIAIDEYTDDHGYQYADVWPNLRSGGRMTDDEKPTSFVRRKRWIRCMGRLDAAAASGAAHAETKASSFFFPFNLSLHLVKANVTTAVSIPGRKIYAVVVMDGIVIGQTKSVGMKGGEWNQTITRPFLTIDHSLEVLCNLYVERQVGLLGPLFLGHVVVPADHLWLNKNRTLSASYPLIPTKGYGNIEIEIRLSTTELFKVEPIVIKNAAETSVQSFLSTGPNPSKRFGLELDNYNISPPVRRALMASNSSLGILQKSEIADVLSDLSCLNDACTGTSKQAETPLVAPNSSLHFESVIGFSSLDADRNNDILSDLRGARNGNERILARNSPEISFGTSSARPFSPSQPASLHLLSNTQSSLPPTYFELTVRTIDGSEYPLRWTEYFDYIMALRAIASLEFHPGESFYCLAYAQQSVSKISSQLKTSATLTPSTGQEMVHERKGLSSLLFGAGKHKKHSVTTPPSETQTHSSSQEALTTGEDSNERLFEDGDQCHLWHVVEFSVNDNRNNCLVWGANHQDWSRRSAIPLTSRKMSIAATSPLNLRVSVHQSLIEAILIRNSSFQPFSHVVDLSIFLPEAVRHRSGGNDLILELSSKCSQFHRVVLSELSAGNNFSFFVAETDLHGALESGPIVAARLMRQNFSSDSFPPVYLGSVELPSTGTGSVREGEELNMSSQTNVYSTSPSSPSSTAGLRFLLDSPLMANVRLVKMPKLNLHLAVDAASSVIGVDLTGTSDVYYVLYLLDSTGQSLGGTIPVMPVSAQSPRSLLLQATSAAVTRRISGVVTGITNKATSRESVGLYRSETCRETRTPTWKKELLIQSCHGLQYASYLLIELWDENTLRADVCLGHVYVPLLPLLSSSVPLDWDVRATSIQHSSKMNPRFASTHDLGTLYFKLKTSLDASEEPADEETEKKQSLPTADVGIQCTIRSLTSRSLRWPASILWKDAPSRAITVEVHFEGLSLYSVLDWAKQRPGKEDEILENCVECVEPTRSDSDENWRRCDILIPWDQVVLRLSTCLGEYMLLLHVLVHRQFFSSALQPDGSRSLLHVAEIELPLLISPCDAAGLLRQVSNRVQAHSIRQALIQQAALGKEEAYFEIGRNVMCEIQNITNGLLHKSGVTSENSIEEFKRLLLRKMRFQGYFGHIVGELHRAIARGSRRIVDSPIMVDRKAEAKVREIASMKLSPAEKLQHMVIHLSDEVSNLVVFELSNSESQLEDYSKELAERLTCLIHSYYNYIVGYLATCVDGIAFEQHSDTQSKHALLQTLISNDDWIDVLLTPFLDTCGCRFTIRPLLSWTLNFDSLVNKFSLVLNAEVLMWEKRALDQFARRKEASHEDAKTPPTRPNCSIPWEIEPLQRTSMRGAQTRSKVIHISNIPESIQEQLFIQIGAKKITPSSSLSPKHLVVVNAINAKITTAVASSYFALAHEYSKGLRRCSELLRRVRRKAGLSNENGFFLELFTKLQPIGQAFHTITSTAASAASAAGSLVVSNLTTRESLTPASDPEVEVEVDSEEALAELEGEAMNFIVSVANDCHRIGSVHLKECMQELDDPTQESSAAHGTFLEAEEALVDVSMHAVRMLSDVVFDDLATIVLSRFDDIWIRSLIATDGSSPNDSLVGEPAVNPLDTILATLDDFLNGVVIGLEDCFLSAFLGVCCRKIVLRYMIFLRDSAQREAERAGTAFHRPVLSEKGASSIVGGNIIFPVAEAVVAKATAAAAVAHGVATGSHMRRRASVKEDIRIQQVLQDFESIRSFFAALDQDFDNEAASNEFGLATLERCVEGLVNRNPMGIDYARFAADVEFLMKHEMKAEVPQFSDDEAVYDGLLVRLLTAHPSTSESQLPSPSDKSPSAVYSVQISDLACLNLSKFKWKLYVRVSIGNTSKSTTLKLKQKSPSWGDVLTFPLQSLDNKILVVEVVEKLPFQVLRDYAYFRLVIPMTGVDVHGGANLSGWYELTPCAFRRESGIFYPREVDSTSSSPRSPQSTSSGRQLSTTEQAARHANFSGKVQLPSEGPKADSLSPQLRIRIKVNQL